MSASDSFLSRANDPHIVFLPSGVASSTPLIRLAVMLASRSCKVTFINIQHEVSCPDYTSFSTQVSKYPGIKLLDVELHWQTLSKTAINDPFIQRFENVNRSLVQLIPVLTLSPVSAILSDFAVAATVAQISYDLNIPFYVVSTTSAQSLSVVGHLPLLMAEDPGMFNNAKGKIEIPGLGSIPKSHIPPSWMQDSPSNYILKTFLLPNALALSNVTGILSNTFDWFEPKTTSALGSNKVQNRLLPPVYPIGPLQPYEPQESLDIPWLNTQPAESVIYVNFGTRELIKVKQMREIGEGLKNCGYSYLWVIKDNEEWQEFPGGPGTGETDSIGKVIRGSVDQERILAHPAIGGFVNQCEWGSVMQAAWHGVPMLAWPQHGDQKMNAEIVDKAGLGIWIKHWDWGGMHVVEGKEITEQLQKMMIDSTTKEKAKLVKKKARETWEVGGSSEKVVELLTRKWREEKNPEK